MTVGGRGWGSNPIRLSACSAPADEQSACSDDKSARAGEQSRRHGVRRRSGRARGGRVGGGGSAGARNVTAAELEQQRRASDAARIRGSYRWLHQGLMPPRAFARSESQYYRDLEASRSRDPPPRRSSAHDLEASSSSAPRRASSSAPAPRRLTFSEGSSSSGPPPSPRFDPGDYAADEDIAAIAARLEMAAPALKAGDFVPDEALGMVTALVEEKSARDADKLEEWRREQAVQDACYIELDSD